MPEPDDEVVGDAIERLEWHDARSGMPSKAARFTRRTALTGGAAGLAAALLEACGSAHGGGTANASAASAGSAVSSIFGGAGGYRFMFVSHAKTNSFFTPTINGIADACTLLGCAYEWTGSASSDPGQMASAINSAIGAGVDGIATSLISSSLAAPVAAAVRAGIPVISYNADDPASARLAYVGQDLLSSGQAMGREIMRLLPGGGEIVVFIATPGLGNLQPRLDGIRQALEGSNIKLRSQASGVAEQQELKTIQAFIGQSLDAYRGYFAVDAGSTSAVAQALRQYDLSGEVVGGGFDLTPDTQQLLSNDTIQFAIDQQPYLQGFLPTLELFLHRESRGLTGAADVDTGVRVLYPDTIKPYATSKSRYEGTSTAAGVQEAT